MTEKLHELLKTWEARIERMKAAKAGTLLTHQGVPIGVRPQDERSFYWGAIQELEQACAELRNAICPE